MRDLHLSFLAWPASVAAGPAFTVHDVTLATLLVSSSPLQQPLPVGFDLAASRLAALPGVYFEHDGSFLWTSRDRQMPWEVSGVLYDQGEFLGYVELWGCCPQREMAELVSAFGGEESPLLVQFVENGVFIETTELLRYCAKQYIDNKI